MKKKQPSQSITVTLDEKITVEIKGQKFVLTRREAEELRDGLKKATGDENGLQRWLPKPEPIRIPAPHIGKPSPWEIPPPRWRPVICEAGNDKLGNDDIQFTGQHILRDFIRQQEQPVIPGL